MPNYEVLFIFLREALFNDLVFLLTYNDVSRDVVQGLSILVLFGIIRLADM